MYKQLINLIKQAFKYDPYLDGGNVYCNGKLMPKGTFAKYEGLFKEIRKSEPDMGSITDSLDEMFVEQESITKKK